MTITRDGKKLELTSEELLEAYQEQQAIYDRQNIADNLSWILDCGNIKYREHELRNNQVFLNLAAKHSRDMQDSEDMNFTWAIEQGVKKAIREMEANHTI